MENETARQKNSSVLKKSLSFLLSLIMLFGISSAVPLTAEAATYKKINALKVPRIYQQAKSTFGGGDCNFDSVASVQAYVLSLQNKSYTYGGVTRSYSYGKDYKATNSSNNKFEDPICQKMYSLSSGTVDPTSILGKLPVVNMTKASCTGNNTSTYEKIYNQLKQGKPVVVHATGATHAGVVIAYTKDSSTLSAANFTIMEITQGGSCWKNSVDNFNKYANSPQTGQYPASCYRTLQSWLNDNGKRTINQIYYPTSTSTTNVTVKFNGNGGTVSTSSMSVSKNAIMGKNIPTATRYGYLFDGWYTAASGGTRYTNSTKITSNITLYAHWSKINDYTGGLKSGRIYQIVNKKSGLALQASGTGNGSLVKQQPKNTNNKSQLWKVGFGGGTVFSSVNGGRVMDIKGGDSNMANGAKLQLFGFDNDNKDNRTFIPVSRGSGYYSIHALHSNRVLDVAGASTNTGVQIQQYYYTGNAQQLFSFEEVSRRTVTFYDNLSNNYLPTPREVYNFSGSSTPQECYTTRNSEYVTTSINASQNKLIIYSKKAGSSGNDIRFKTTLNSSYNYEMYDANTNTVYLGFTAKSSVQGTKMYFRWGYDSEYKSVTLNTTSTNYLIELPRTKNSDEYIYPYIDRACTIEMSNIQLKDKSSGSIDFSNGDSFNGQVKYYDVNNQIYGNYFHDLPTPTKTKSGYTFDGWYTSRVGGTRIDTFTQIKYNTKLYAHWKETPIHNHQYNYDYTVKSSCTQQGYTVYTCSCGDSYKSNYVSATGHSYDAGKITKKPTSTSTGIKTYTCTKCKATKTETVAKIKLPAPAAKITVNANGSFKIYWNKISGADKYDVYIDNGTGYKLLRTVTGTSTTTETAHYGKKYAYKVRAINSKDSSVTSAFSAVVTATNTKKLVTPKAAQAKVNANGTFTLSWDKVTGATRYGIYMLENGKYKWIKSTSAVSWTTGTAQYGKKYTYKVFAVNDNNKTADSNFSSPFSATNNKKLQTPSLKVAVNKNGSFKLSWGKVTGAEKYELYIKQANGSYKLMKTTTSTSFTTAVASKGKTYSYKIKAVTSKNKNTASNYSNTVSAKRK